jgi:hypothetical protein
MAVPLVALLTGLVGCSAGCSANETTATTEIPACTTGDDGDAANGVVLMAQSVPSAEWVPCLRTALPLGWAFHHLDARDRLARFWLDSDRDGQKAIEVSLRGGCDTDGATRIPSERDGMVRLERVTQTSPDFRGVRYYVFDGGCITFTFQLAGQERGEALALATQAIGAVSRDDLRAQVHDESGGRLSLDPASTEDD